MLEWPVQFFELLAAVTTWRRSFIFTRVAPPHDAMNLAGSNT